MVSDGYPIKFSANNTKGEYIALGLKKAGCKVAMLDEFYGTKGVLSAEKGVSDSGLDYLLLPRVGKVLSPFYTLPQIWKYLRERKEKGGKNHIIIGMKFYPLYILVCFMAWLQGYTRSSLFHEWHISFGNNTKRWYSEAWLKDKTFGYLLNCIFPIGHFLKERTIRFGKPVMLVPVMGEYDRIPKLYRNKHTFTYCCGAGYLIRNRLVLDAFKMLISDKNFSHLVLALVLIGKPAELETVKCLVKDMSISDNVIIKNQISQAELYDTFDNSIGLIIPLNPDSLQDIARFSQKIAEYVASKRPIITSNVGEIPYYFKDNESAKIVPFSIEGYFHGMKMLAENPILADEIGTGGYEVGCEKFDYEKVGEEMKTFIESL